MRLTVRAEEEPRKEDRLTGGWLRRKFGEELDVTAEKCLHYDRRERSKDSGELQ